MHTLTSNYGPRSTGEKVAGRQREGDREGGKTDADKSPPTKRTNPKDHRAQPHSDVRRMYQETGKRQQAPNHAPTPRTRNRQIVSKHPTNERTLRRFKRTYQVRNVEQDHHEAGRDPARFAVPAPAPVPVAVAVAVALAFAPLLALALALGFLRRIGGARRARRRCGGGEGARRGMPQPVLIVSPYSLLSVRR